jgi:hypothetical protein
MKLFTPRKGPSQNVAFVGISVAIVAIIAAISLATEWLPVSSFALMLIVPIVASLTVALIEDKYVPLFVIGGVAISLAVTASNLSQTFFYLLPSLVGGTVYAEAKKKGAPTAISAFLTAMVTMGFHYLALPIIKAIYDVDMIAFILQLLSLDDKPWIYDIVPAFIFSYSLAEVALQHLFIELVVYRLVKVEEQKPKLAWLSPIISLAFSGLAIGLPFASLAAAYYFLIAGIYFAAFSFIYCLGRGKPLYYVILVCLIIASVFAMAALYPYYPERGGLALIGLFAMSFAIPSLFPRHLLKEEPKTPIVN